MNKYESVLIARQDLGSSQVNALVDSLKEVVSAQGGEVVRVDNWGLQNLAYRIKKNRKGHYVLLNISAPAKAVAEYERVMRVNEDIIRYMTVKVDEFCDASTGTDSADEAVVVEEQEGMKWLNKYFSEEKRAARFPVKMLLRLTTKM